jgi:hypothetical protein
MPDRLRELHRVTHSRGSGDRGLHFQRAVDAKHHLIVAHEATNVGSDREQLATMDTRTRAAMGHKTHAVVADRGYLLRQGLGILACGQACIAAYMPKPIPPVPKPRVASADGTLSPFTRQTDTGVRHGGDSSSASATSGTGTCSIAAVLFCATAGQQVLHSAANAR